MTKEALNNPNFIIEQLDEALEERKGGDRRKTAEKAAFDGEERRKMDRRNRSAHEQRH